MKGASLLSTVGIIANPASGKDIRRLVAYGSVFDNQEKVRIVRRVLIGLEALGVKRVLYMPDYFGIVRRALTQINTDLSVVPVEIPLQGNQEDSTSAARRMETEGAGCIITLGGDGTNRVVAKGNNSVPILPISTGTNNVFPLMVEGTVAGMAAGMVANELVPLKKCTFLSTKLEVVLNEKVEDLALVDVVVYDEDFVASRAVLDMEKVYQVFLNRAEPHSIGLSSIGGLLMPVGFDEARGLCLEIGKVGRYVTAPIAPGLIKEVVVSNLKTMNIGDKMGVSLAPSILALDGEREVEVNREHRASIRLARNGPRVVDVTETMAAATKRGILASQRTDSGFSSILPRLLERSTG